MELRWVPSHSRVKGEERVDELAKRLRRSGQSILAQESPLPNLSNVTVSTCSLESLRQVLVENMTQTTHGTMSNSSKVEMEASVGIEKLTGRVSPPSCITPTVSVLNLYFSYKMSCQYMVPFSAHIHIFSQHQSGYNFQAHASWHDHILASTLKIHREVPQHRPGVTPLIFVRKHMQTLAGAGHLNVSSGPLGSKQAHLHCGVAPVGRSPTLKRATSISVRCHLEFLVSPGTTKYLSTILLCYIYVCPNTEVCKFKNPSCLCRRSRTTIFPRFPPYPTDWISNHSLLPEKRH